MNAAVARSSLVTTLNRYSYSRGLWILLLLAPVAARFMIAQDDGVGLQVTIGRHLPVMTSATLGVTLGIIVSTLLLPAGFLYLRSNITRIQPWQIEEVTPASRVAISLGRFAADVVVLFALLVALTLAGWLLGWLVGSGPLNVWQITLTLWVVAAPSLMGLAAIRVLLDAMPLTRGGFGDFVFFLLWLSAIAVPAVLSALPSTYASNMVDFAGFVRPLAGPAPMKMGDFTIGITQILPGRVPLDAMAGLYSPGYLASRLSWAAIAVVLAAAAGLVYRPHAGKQSSRKEGRIARFLAAPRPQPANAAAPPAPFARVPFITLLVAEFRLIGGGRLFRLLAVAAALLGLLGDYRHVGSAAALLLLVFGLSSHGGQSESKGLRSLTSTTLLSPALRRIAFVLAGTGWALLLALPAAIVRLSVGPVYLALATGAAAALIAIILAAVSRSAFAPRLVLLLLWYGYLSS